jgi:hypothetical protein
MARSSASPDRPARTTTKDFLVPCWHPAERVATSATAITTRRASHRARGRPSTRRSSSRWRARTGTDIRHCENVRPTAGLITIVGVGHIEYSRSQAPSLRRRANWRWRSQRPGASS